jgi:hypothetical protein
MFKLIRFAQPRNRAAAGTWIKIGRNEKQEAQAKFPYISLQRSQKSARGKRSKRDDSIA